MKRTSLFSVLADWIKSLNTSWVQPLLFILLALFICFMIKYTFINTCIGSSCPHQNGEISGSLLTIGGLLVAIIALVPAFWVDGKLKDAKEEVRRQITEDIRKDVVKLATAHSHLLKAHSDTHPNHLLEYEGYIQQAISLDPAIKEQEYPFLGKSFARTALELNAGTIDTRPGTSLMSNALFPSDTLYTSDTLFLIDTKTAIQKAIFYLEESIPYVESGKDYDRMFHIDLACMYVCS